MSWWLCCRTARSEPSVGCGEPPHVTSVTSPRAMLTPCPIPTSVWAGCRHGRERLEQSAQQTPQVPAEAADAAVPA